MSWFYILEHPYTFCKKKTWSLFQAFFTLLLKFLGLLKNHTRILNPSFVGLLRNYLLAIFSSLINFTDFKIASSSNI